MDDALSQQMIKLFEEIEIEAILFGMTHDKVCGPDGFPMRTLKK